MRRTVVLDVVAAADWVVDLGPGGGREGGRVVAEGAPAELRERPESPTGRALARLFPGVGKDKSPG